MERTTCSSDNHRKWGKDRSQKSDVGKGQMPDVRNQKGKSKGQKSEVGSLNKRDGWMKWRGTEVTSEKGLEK